MKRILKWAVLALLLAVMAFGAYVLFFLWQHHMFEAPSYDESSPEIVLSDERPNILLFSKTNNFRHIEAIPQVQALFAAQAQQQGWNLVVTDNAAVHTRDNLKRFDLLIWNNVTGDVLTIDQRQAFKSYIKSGGRVLGIHGTGGTPEYLWNWYPEEFIRARFNAHPLTEQFQDARLIIDDPVHPTTAHLPQDWVLKDEWYSFHDNPRARVNVLLSLDETSYNPSKMFSDGALKMGDHPIVWWHEIGEGRVFYSAIGHRAELYEDENYKALLEEAARWMLE